MSFLWELIILASRIIIVMYSIMMKVWSSNQTENTFQQFCRQTMVIRFALGLNILNLLPDLLKNTTLVWEEAAIFYDLLIAIGQALVPLAIFILYIVFTFVFLFYTIGKHQLTFDFFSEINLDDMEGGIVREYPNGNTPG